MDSQKQSILEETGLPVVFQLQGSGSFGKDFAPTETGVHRSTGDLKIAQV